MTPDAEAASPASPKSQGDGKPAAANVTAAQTIARFVKRSEQAQEAAQTADTKASQAPKAETPATPDTSESAAEPANEAASPDTSETPSGEDKADKADAKPEGEEAEAVLSPENSTLDQKTKEKIQRRIDKEVGKRKAVEAQVEQLRAQLAEVAAKSQQAQPQVPLAGPQIPDPLPNIKDFAALTEYKKLAKQAQREAEELLDREDIDQGVEVSGKTYTKADIKRSLREARVALEDVIPQKEELFRQQYIVEQQKQQVVQVARQKFSFLAEPDNADVKQATEVLNGAYPGFLDRPIGPWLLGLIVEGKRAMDARETAAKAPKADAKPDPAKEPAKPAAPKQKPPGDQAAVSAAGSVARMTPDVASRSAIGAEFDKLKSRRGADANSVAEFLAKKESLKQR